jgi:hypothetical protein
VTPPKGAGAESRIRTPGQTRLRRQIHAFAMAIWVGVLLMLLVAAAIADRGGPLPWTVPGVSAAAMGALYLAFPHGALFSLGAATGLAIYACLYVVIGRAAFPAAPDWALVAGHALPITVFVLVCLVQRDRLRGYAQQGVRTADLMHIGDFTRWLAVVAAVGVVSLSSPLSRMAPEIQGFALVTAMALIAVISVTAVDDVVRLLVDMAVIFRTVTRRMEHLIVPMAAYTSLWTLLAVVFGCIYRIADGLSREHLFRGPDGPTHIGFSDALHFSVVTLTTVGYGDLNPVDDGIRLIAAIQMLLAQLLLLFGFVEIMRNVREDPAHRHGPGAAPPQDRPASAHRPQHRPGGAEAED